MTMRKRWIVSVRPRPLSCLFELKVEWNDLMLLYTASYSFFDSYDVELLGRARRRQDPHTVGEPVLGGPLNEPN